MAAVVALVAIGGLGMASHSGAIGVYDRALQYHVQTQVAQDKCLDTYAQQFDSCSGLSNFADHVECQEKAKTNYRQCLVGGIQPITQTRANLMSTENFCNMAFDQDQQKCKDAVSDNVEAMDECLTRAVKQKSRCMGWATN